MRDAEGKLQNVQRIAPQRPEEGSDKRFLPGGRKQGLSHLIGPEPVDVLLMAEGYATAATLREALLLPVVVAFDAGNLRTVAQQLPQRWPGVRVLVCADNDHETESRTARTGRDRGAPPRCVCCTMPAWWRAGACRRSCLRAAATSTTWSQARVRPGATRRCAAGWSRTCTSWWRRMMRRPRW